MIRNVNTPTTLGEKGGYKEVKEKRKEMMGAPLVASSFFVVVFFGAIKQPTRRKLWGILLHHGTRGKDVLYEVAK